MPSWNDGEESTEEEFVGMDMELCENPHTRVDASFYDKASDPSIKCTLRLAPCLKYVAFEGIHTRRRFYGCGNGIDCGVFEWVDAPWPGVLQRCLVKFWEMFHEENHGRILGTLYSQLVEDVTKLFDWRDAEEQNKQFQNDEDPQKKEMDLVVDHKELKCIVRSHGEITGNARKERDLPKEEKTRLEYVVGDLLKVGQGNKDKLAKMKAILDE
ncbi:hypothetical protein ZWY2020_057442 [Hordeum vulgare]|nr:hypothetical protein ZWY2020_057442 [Hordeum vulgare]